VGRAVSVEVHVSNGLPGFTIVGLPDAAVREARDRVRAAVLSSGLSWPLRRVTVNLAPSGVRKGGAGLDLPIAVGLLVAAGELSPGCTEGVAFCGELGLNGSLRHVPGMIALADTAGPRGLVVPLCDVREAALVRGDARGAWSGGGIRTRWPGRAARRDRRLVGRDRPGCHRRERRPPGRPGQQRRHQYDGGRHRPGRTDSVRHECHRSHPCHQAALPLLEQSENPVVVNVSSALGSFWAVTNPERRQFHFPSIVYGSSKAAVSMLTVQYAKTFPGIKFNAVEPGFTSTDLTPFSGAGQPLEKGAEVIVRMATVGKDGPTGSLQEGEGELAW
jgi:Subunit ChlI of Mg-chelatase/short chain dehydrogenase